MDTVQHEATNATPLTTEDAKSAGKATRRFFDLSSILSRRRSRERVTEPSARSGELKMSRWREPGKGGAA
jgi:hypothetical protein